VWLFILREARMAKWYIVPVCHYCYPSVGKFDSQTQCVISCGLSFLFIPVLPCFKKGFFSRFYEFWSSCALWSHELEGVCYMLVSVNEHVIILVWKVPYILLTQPRWAVLLVIQHLCCKKGWWALKLLRSHSGLKITRRHQTLSVQNHLMSG